MIIHNCYVERLTLYWRITQLCSTREENVGFFFSCWKADSTSRIFCSSFSTSHYVSISSSYCYPDRTLMQTHLDKLEEKQAHQDTFLLIQRSVMANMTWTLFLYLETSGGDEWKEKLKSTMQHPCNFDIQAVPPGHTLQRQQRLFVSVPHWQSDTKVSPSGSGKRVISCCFPFSHWAAGKDIFSPSSNAARQFGSLFLPPHCVLGPEIKLVSGASKRFLVNGAMSVGCTEGC